MKRFWSLIMTTLLLLVVPTASWSKGQTIRIEIAGDGLTDPIVITDPELLSQFNIWNGPGVSVRGPDGVPYPPAHLDPNQSGGRFIDWPRGIVQERPSGLQRLEVSFFVAVPRRPGEERSYIVAYEVDTSELRGFIFLPMWMNNLISHGAEGNWFFATERWNEIIGPIIAKQTKNLTAPTERGNLSCVAGHGSLSQDGTIEFKLFDDDGRNISHWRYETSSEGYDNLLDHIGDVEPGEEIEVSCWPARS
jgi:hypothetical protein